ncbi:flagellar hook-basal body complex protein FliE [Sneathiella chungangensis]|uniref:Flagellar hook-basal body complex protein FliE n=1 Tax=Sneathiella chungangensis TaxID=1418234 RepID=A0A845MBI0_9PROT|nr:flagellar hook-basal body complex protein FliE [Sneathiella chungangensis]MZR21112.1 flagellar hook-basal body complex protein FliE [Sneathiella chungangensis]
MADTSALAATQAYSKAINNTLGAKPSGGANEAAEAVGGPSFAEMLASAGTEAIETGVNSEQISLEAITGDAGLADIVTAVSNAEATLETVVAVRDRVIQAYQDIIKMPI